MRITRILLVLVFLAVAAVYTVQDFAGRFTKADDPPVLTCDTEILSMSVADEDSAMLAGVTATDPQDGDISDQVLVSSVSRLIDGNTAKISYVVFDSDHNMATLTRFIRYTDYRLPRFSLDEALIYPMNAQVKLLDRLHAQDVVDGDITGAIRVSYSAGTAASNRHEISVQVTNSLGDTAWLTLPVLFLDDFDDRIEVDLDAYLIYLKQGDTFLPRRYLNGASYQGNPIGNDNIAISGDVDTGTPGTYYVEYTCTYGSRTGTAILTVVVE